MAEKKEEVEKKEEAKKKRKIEFQKMYKTEPIDKVLRPRLKKYIQPDIITRRQWRARFPTGYGSMDPLEFPLNQVIVTLTESSPCGDEAECTYAIRGMQTYFMRMGYHDIPYNFIITTEGKVFEGRAWVDECPLPAGLGRDSKTLVIGVVGNKIDYSGKTKDTIDAQIKNIIDHGLKHELLEPRFLKREVDSWHFRIKYSPDDILKEKGAEMKKDPLALK